MVALAHQYRMPATWLRDAFDDDPWLMAAQVEYVHWYDQEVIRLSKQRRR